MPTPDQAGPLAEEAILILEPGPGSRLPSPLHISGIAGPAFEQTLVVRVISADGQELALAPAQINAELGQRGKFAVDLAVSVDEAMPAFIQVYTTSPRDGGLTHLSAVIVNLKTEGGVELKPVSSHLEQLVIQRPAAGETVRGGIMRLEGFGWASFEQTLVVEVIGPDGALAGRSPVLVNSLEMGQPGPFSIELPYTLTGPAGPGRIVVRDPSAAFDGDMHLTSVEVNLEP